MKTFSLLDRSSNLGRMGSNEVFDVFVVGGGINGAGVARDMALRGMKVILAESNDFASGTSSRSSKLIHGGIRYLENMEFHLVFEALSERKLLFQMAPHLVHPLRFLLPLFKGGRVGMFKMGLGMFLYDALSLFEMPQMHEKLSMDESLNRVPSLQSKDLLGSYEYSDAYMDDDLLTIETLRSAQAAGAICFSYMKVTQIQWSEGHGKSPEHEGLSNNYRKITIFDQLNNKSYEILARHIVGAVGPWTDIFGSSIFPKWKTVLRPTKGVHLVFSKDRFPLTRAVVMAAEERIVFAIPRHDMVILGTTDTDFHDQPEKISVTNEDIQYLLSIVNRYFPGAHIKEEDILSSFVGLRPLISPNFQNSSLDVGKTLDQNPSEKKNDISSPSSTHEKVYSESKTSREHYIWSYPKENLTFIAGGKYTTYRKIAEEITMEVLKFFPIQDRVKFHQSRTKSALNPNITEDSYQRLEAGTEEILKNSSLGFEDAQKLFFRWGWEAVKMTQKFQRNSYTYWQWEALHAIQFGMCFHLHDFLRRRSPLYLSQKDHGKSYLNAIAQVFQETLHWDKERLNDEMSRAFE